MQAGAITPSHGPWPVGRPFVGSSFDLMVIGGGLTFPLALWAWWHGASLDLVTGLSLPVLILLVNQAHFAASTVRLYTKPGAFQSYPFLTMGLPIVTLLVLSVFVIFAQQIGWHLWALHATWSPFHYAAQTFGLASMYCYRSGCMLTERERLLLRATCLMPFLSAFLGAAPNGIGLGWLVPYPWILANGAVETVYSALLGGCRFLTLALPLALLVGVGRSPGPGPARPRIPLISMVLVLSNGIWWVVFDYIGAFAWSTVLHGLQYLAIVAVFHVREQMADPQNEHGRFFHVAGLYAMCLGLGYLLFQCWPRAYMAMGFGHFESVAMVLAVINVHHFIVDAYIWRLRSDRHNQELVESASG